MLIVITGVALIVAIAVMAGAEMEDQKRAENLHVVAESVARFIR